MHEAHLLLSFPDPPTASAVHGALSPESRAAPDVPKTRATLTREAHEVHIRLDADDLSALRAALNSYLRWADAAERAARIAAP